MAKPKRMSDIFASSAEKDSSAVTAPATPYSSEGPTLPIIGGADADGEHTVGPESNQAAKGSRKKRKTEENGSEIHIKADAQPVPSFDPSLYQPWTLLPAELLKISQDRLRGTKNVVPIAYTRNQNIKGGINRLKTYLGAYKNKNQPMDMPEALKEADVVIAVSAQGEGTAKLVSIVDLVRRVVAPTSKSKLSGGNVETWYMYTSLANIEVEKRAKAMSDGSDSNGQAEKPKSTADEDEEEEEEAFELMDVDAPEQEQEQQQKQTTKAPILTVWMTKKNIPAFKEAFGEQTFEVQALPLED
ncbi:hypothetical protein HBI04_109460 [Parastagonospora nodorum]|nr:hypothetical protein HBI03_139970 [Parastagonospora nodorum]KAH4276494.1 hypothetical protein HBI04_109460 [Parastagonospora nodorum]KAH4969059.1 hypothetical protein HBI78_061910 [Parastagonospora nodorum]KAH5538478.1 hypothetical protein HBI27_126380 [Parastagonospora nodorum]